MVRSDLAPSFIVASYAAAIPVVVALIAVGGGRLSPRSADARAIWKATRRDAPLRPRRRGDPA